MSILIMMIGFPGSGREFLSEELSDVYDAFIVEEAVEHQMASIAQTHLMSGENVIINAPNINRTMRRHVLNRLLNLCDEIIAVDVKSTVEECISNVPFKEDTVIFCAKKYEVPGYDEGFTKIIITDSNGTDLFE